MMHQTLKSMAAVLASAILVSSPAHAAEGKMKVVGSDRMGLIVLRNSTPLFRLNGYVVGKGWMIKPKLEGTPAVKDRTRVFEQKGLGFFKAWANKPTGSLIDLTYEIEKTGAREVLWTIRSKPEQELQYAFPNQGTGLGAMLGMSPYFMKGACKVEFNDGSSEDLPYPTPARWGKPGIKAITLSAADGETTKLTFEPPLFMHSDNNELRLFANPPDVTPTGGTMVQKIAMTLPQDIAFEPDNRWVDTSDWITYEHEDNFAPGSVIGVEDWLDKPAGKHGWVKVDGDNFVLENGKKIKFFATNISWDDMACPQEEADQWNDKWAKHGVNLVRLHKFINHNWAGIMSPEDHMIPDPEKIKLFDYYHASARKRGIYLSWSAVFHMKLTPADKNRVKYFDEVKQAQPKDLDVLGLKNIAPDIQDLLIKQTVALLERTNSVTGIRYADDPALAYIELHNEDDIFFPFDDYRKMENTYPKYFADFQQRFCAYLEKKYGSQEALEKAWGAAYPAGKTLAKADIRISYNSWNINHGAMNLHVADSMHFMYTEQSGFYHRFVNALRAAGFQGAICGGCWQAACWMGHLYNTLTDYEVGFIDRHNYSGTPLNRPGVGTMSAAFQQVKNRPFNFSEWGGGDVAVPTVMVYGLGLQGWDASCQFSSKIPGTYNKMQRSCNGCCEDFIQISQYPALSRMVYRGDVKEGAVIANRQISIPGLFKGDVGIYEHFSLLGGGANTKEFSSVVPAQALMAGRVVLEFIDAPVPEEPVIESTAQYIDEEKKIVRSCTGQLIWDYSGRGYYTVNTPGTKAIVGYAGGMTVDLGEVAINLPGDTSYKVYVSALDKEQVIQNAKRLLVTALGRDANSGMAFDEFGSLPLISGGEPLLIEPVKAAITVKSGKIKAVHPLDHSGRMKQGAATLEVSSNKSGDTFTVDGATSKTMYYLVEMK